ncbi:DMT family transporter [Variovorax sp. PCZ-1]|nr:DMT family transporter [Variovorax sp. PCZ-1]
MQTERKDHLDGLAIVLLLGCCLFWGFQQVLAKATISEVPPVFQSAVRAMGATLLLMIWCKARGISLFVRDGTLWVGLFAGGLFSFEFVCIYLALNLTGASRVTVFLYTSPFWVAALLPLFVRAERMNRMQWLGLFCAFAAVVFALWESLQKAGAGRMGDVLALLAGASWGLTTVTIRATALAKISAERLLFYQLACSAVSLPFVSLAFGESWPAMGQLSSFALLSLFLQTAVGAFASYLLWMWMLTRYPAGKMSAFVFLTPVFALLFAALWLGEPVTPNLVIAIALVGAGIILVNRR